MSTRAYLSLAFVCAWFALGFAAGCGGGSQSCSGGERCACYPNGTCNAGLTCLSNVCVDSSTGAGGNAGTTGRGGSDGGGAGTGGSAAGSGGAVAGAGGTNAGSGGSAAGVGGAAAGTGGSAAGTAGSAAGTAGSATGTAGSAAGTTGATAGSGGSGAGTGGAVAGSSGSAGRGGTGGGGTGGGATGGTGQGGTGVGGSGSGGAGGACRLFQTVPGGSTTTPTVFVLVDRSGSMFGCAGDPVGISSCANPANTPWAILRTGVLSVIEDLQATVRFGFGAFTGNVANNQCPLFEQVSTSLDNHAAISALYGPLGAITGKAETPVGAALDRAKAVLDADTTGGPKYILFVTDGEPDYCNDGQAICAVDSVVGRLQSLRTGGITTLIFGIQNGGTTGVPLPTLQAFANAGAGAPVAAVVPAPYDVAAISDQCQGVQPWRADITAAGKAFARGVSFGSYTVGAPETATVYKPNPVDAQALEALIATTVGGLKSCNFDLVNGLAVDLSKVDQATVTIETQSIPRSDTNGWRMVNTRRLELVGTACALWRQPASRSIDFNFPCGVVTGS
jgi:hypothetical protein